MQKRNLLKRKIFVFEKLRYLFLINFLLNIKIDYTPK